MSARGPLRRLALAVCLAWPGLAAATPASDFAAGNEAFWQGDYGQAAQAYRRVIDEGVRNADVYYNLGNAEAAAGRLGHAVWAFEQALALRPADADAAYNLKAVTSQIVSEIGAEGSQTQRIVPGQSDVGTDLFTALSPLTLALLAGGFWLALFALLILTRRAAGGRRTALAFTAVLAGLGALGFGGLILGRELVVNQSAYAVVIAPKARAMVGPGAHYKVSAELLPGVKVQVRGADDGWVHITLPNGAGAWLRERALASLTR